MERERVHTMTDLLEGQVLGTATALLEDRLSEEKLTPNKGPMILRTYDQTRLVQTRHQGTQNKVQTSVLV